ncbi:uncharacterized protein LOC107615432 [Arachis ipaensis]|uniref:uncharacterized protein LOC107615432 n=1 Tax=Arachis ipaensis TaxID=130454 RepID=UPI0007AF592F|nr:uncharacterized protein LOC107615432 [Arachis ipaensis]
MRRAWITYVQAASNTIIQLKLSKAADEGAKPIRQPERHLNPTILEVVKKEVSRLLEADIIYPISDDLLEHCIEVFMDDFSVYGDSFDLCLDNLAKDFSKVALPLSRLLQKDVEFDLSEECMEAFDKIKIALTQAPIVRGPDWSRPFEIMCDLSNYAVGVALTQREGKNPYVIGYVFKTLDGAQSNYTTTEKELLAIVFALDKFRAYLLGSVDYVSKWVEAILTRTDDANDAGLMKKYDIIHKVATAYHPQTNSQAEVSNREIKRILEKIVKPHRKDWSSKLGDALWAYRTAYKTPIGMSPFWKLQLVELECLRLEAYKNSRLYKERMKVVHDENIIRREFRAGELVLLYNSRLRLMPGKLRWEGPYRVEKAESYGVYHLRHPSSPNIFKVNDHRLKLYHGEKMKSNKEVKVFLLEDAPEGEEI